MVVNDIRVQDAKVLVTGAFVSHKSGEPKENGRAYHCTP